MDWLQAILLAKEVFKNKFLAT